MRYQVGEKSLISSKTFFFSIEKNNDFAHNWGTPHTAGLGTFRQLLNDLGHCEAIVLLDLVQQRQRVVLDHVRGRVNWRRVGS